MRLLKGKQEERDISAQSALLWAEYYRPMQQAAVALNEAIANTQNIIATVIAKNEGLDPTDWMFDISRLKLVRKPKG